MDGKNNELSEKLKEDLSKEQLKDLESRLEEAGDDIYDRIEGVRLKSVFVTTLLSILFGYLGIGSFYVGRILSGVLKIIFAFLYGAVIASFFVCLFLSEQWIMLPGTFLIVGGIIWICWWIGEVFNDREKCRKANYEILLKAIEK